MPQVSVAMTATVISAARTGKDSVIIENHGATPVYIGYDSGVTTANGFRLPGVDGASLTLDCGSNAVYGVVGAGSQTVSVIETSR